MMANLVLGPSKLRMARLIGLVFLSVFGAAIGGNRPSAQDLMDDEELLVYAVHINRTPRQPWPGYGVYLGNGLILTAAHVPGKFAETKPLIAIAGVDLPATLVREGSLDTVDLTLLSVDSTKLPMRLRLRRLSLCEQTPTAGETVTVVTPEGAARSHVLPPSAIPRDFRLRFGTVIGDVAATGNSGSGVFDARRQCLLGIISRKISVGRQGVRPGAPTQTKDIAKYFVPARDIKAFLPANVSF
jgi:hypothetical protein